MVIETSLVSPAESKQVRKVDLNWTCFSVHTRTEQYDILPLLFTRERNSTISYRSSFWFTLSYCPISGQFGTDRLIFFRTREDATPLRTTFWNGPKWNGTISYPCEQDLIKLSLKMTGWKEQEPETELSIKHLRLSIARTKVCCNLLWYGLKSVLLISHTLVHPLIWFVIKDFRKKAYLFYVGLSCK